MEDEHLVNISPRSGDCPCVVTALPFFDLGSKLGESHGPLPLVHSCAFLCQGWEVFASPPPSEMTLPSPRYLWSIICFFFVP